MQSMSLLLAIVFHKLIREVRMYNVQFNLKAYKKLCYNIVGLALGIQNISLGL